MTEPGDIASVTIIEGAMVSWLELLAPWGLTAVGIGGLVAAFLRFGVADRNRLEDQFVKGAELLDHKVRPTSYSGRVAGAVTLADLALREPDHYDERVMRVFQPFLDFPPRYGQNHKFEGQVDYTSADTVAVCDAINKRKPKARRKYRMRLSERRPFHVTDSGDVERNPDYDDPGARQPPTKHQRELIDRYRAERDALPSMLEAEPETAGEAGELIDALLKRARREL